MIDQNTANEIGYRSDANDDGEFFIEIDDFCGHFKHLIICTLNMSAENFKLINGIWVGNENAGGSRNDIVSFATNPQYLFYISNKRSENDKIPNSEHRGRHDQNIIVALMQDYRRSERNTFQIKLCQIGFIVYRVSLKNEETFKHLF